MAARPTLRRIAFVAFVVWLGGAGCASSGALSAAEAGDREALAAAIRAELEAGDLDADLAGDIAMAVASREIATAKGAAGVRTVRTMGGCAKPMSSSLFDRADEGDEVAASASMMLLDLGLADQDDYVQFASDRRPEWRAVGARALALPEQGVRRRELIVDGDERVRLGAIRASADASDASDVAALLEALRLDPLPMARTVAARALGGIGGEDVVLALRDAWVLAGPAEREAIAGAWASPASLDAGGRRELLWAVDTQTGSPGIAAAVELARAGGPGSGDAFALLGRSIREGAVHDRVFAISASPADLLVTEALVASKGDDDPLVRVAVLGRIATTMPAKHARPAIQALRTIAQEGSPTAQQAAKSALATAKAPVVLPMLISDLDDSSDGIRRAAGRGLVRMGKPERAVILVADPDPSVRSSVSCAIVAAR